MLEASTVADRLTEELPAQMARHDVPGTAVGLVNASGLLWSTGFGVLRVLGPDEVGLEDGSGERFRFTGDDGSGRPTHLVSLDGGYVRYRNDLPAIAESPPTGPWNRSYTVQVFGSRVADVRLLRDARGAAVIDLDGVQLCLTEYTSDLYFCSMGEALDLTRTPITYANVPLHPVTSTS